MSTSYQSSNAFYELYVDGKIYFWIYCHDLSFFVGKLNICLLVMFVILYHYFLSYEVNCRLQNARPIPPRICGNGRMCTMCIRFINASIYSGENTL